MIAVRVRYVRVPKKQNKETWQSFLRESDRRMEQSNKSKRAGRERVYTKSFSTRQSFGAASEVRTIKS